MDWNDVKTFCAVKEACLNITIDEEISRMSIAALYNVDNFNESDKSFVQVDRSLKQKME